jgi:hypothetical protein
MVDLLQWPAMAVTLLAAWFASSSESGKRKVGFWLYLASNALWVTWGWGAAAYALIGLQIGLAVMNTRGAVKARAAEGDGGDKASSAPPT